MPVRNGYRPILRLFDFLRVWLSFSPAVPYFSGHPCPERVEGLLRRLALFPGCVVRGRLKPGEFEGVPLGVAGALFGRLRRRRYVLPPLRLEPPSCRLFGRLSSFPPDPMDLPHRGRPPVAARPGMELFEGVEIPAPDAAAFGKQGSVFVRPGAEGSGLLEQRGVAGEGFPELPAERHAIAFDPGAFAQGVPGRQDLPAAVGEGGNGPGMTPAEGGAPDIPRNAGERVVVRRPVDLVRTVRPFSGGPAAIPPDTLAPDLLLPDLLSPVLPFPIGHVVERRLLGLGARPAFGQPGPDLGVGHGGFPVVAGPVAVGPPVGNIEGERRPVDIDVEAVAMARRGRIDGLARRPGVGEQERPVDGQPLGRGNSERIAVIETDIAVPVADLVMAEADPAAVVGTAGNQDARLPTGLPAGRATGIGPQDP